MPANVNPTLAGAEWIRDYSRMFSVVSRTRLGATTRLWMRHSRRFTPAQVEAIDRTGNVEDLLNVAGYEPAGAHDLIQVPNGTYLVQRQQPGEGDFAARYYINLHTVQTGTLAGQRILRFRDRDRWVGFATLLADGSVWVWNRWREEWCNHRPEWATLSFEMASMLLSLPVHGRNHVSGLNGTAYWQCVGARACNQCNRNLSVESTSLVFPGLCIACGDALVEFTHLEVRPALLLAVLQSNNFAVPLLRELASSAPSATGYGEWPLSAGEDFARQSRTDEDDEEAEDIQFTPRQAYERLSDALTQTAEAVQPLAESVREAARLTNRQRQRLEGNRRVRFVNRQSPASPAPKMSEIDGTWLQ